MNRRFWEHLDDCAACQRWDRVLAWSTRATPCPVGDELLADGPDNDTWLDYNAPDAAERAALAAEIQRTLK